MWHCLAGDCFHGASVILGGIGSAVWHLAEEVDRVSSPLSDVISKDLKKRGMKFVGPIIIYAYLQAVGVINSHESGCFLNPSQQ